MSQIEWTDETWNPIVGCDRLSAGCDNCYAIRMAHRFNHPHYRGVTTRTTEGVDWTGLINTAPEHIITKPTRQKRPTVYFVNSMSDMFHNGVKDADLIRFFRIMNKCPQHTFQVLTKRPSRMARKTLKLGLRWTENIWAGTTIEEDKYAAPRVRELSKVPASLRFVSAEPLLSALPSLDIPAVDWVIAGGESGVGRSVRPADPNWFRDLRNRCRVAGVPFFFKQWGAFGPDGKRGSKSANGHLLDGHEIFEMPAAAYDRMEKPDRRWVRYLPPQAQHRPSGRYALSEPRFVIDGEPTDDLHEYVLALVGDTPGTYANPNRKLTTEDKQ